MSADVIAQIVTVLVAVLGIIWHQQHSTDKLRDEVSRIGQRLARIEGFLRIGIPPEAVTPQPLAVDPPAPAADPAIEPPAAG